MIWKLEPSQMRQVWGMFAAAALVLTAGAPGAESPVPLERAHSHNDYYRQRPLLDALELGICSVEADIFLVDGELLVAHDLHRTAPDKTLRGMYLEPLLERARKNNGRIYPDGPPVILLIDIKDDGEKTYAKLREVLKDYEEMLTVFTHDSTEPRAVTVLISGSTPRDTIAAESPRLAAIDGRLPDIEKGTSPHLTPLVSASWSSVFQWRGDGPMPEEEQARLKELVAKAHANGQRIRFWGLPFGRQAWPALYEAGVDLLNADHLPAIHKFLHERMREERVNAP